MRSTSSIVQNRLDKDPQEPEVTIGDHQYFTADQIAKLIGVARYHIINLVRKYGLSGRRIGTVYLIDSNDFNEWVKAGKFEKQPYTKNDRDESGDRELSGVL